MAHRVVGVAGGGGKGDEHVEVERADQLQAVAGRRGCAREGANGSDAGAEA